MHYANGGVVACGREASEVTAIPGKVTCGRCKRTTAYKTAAGEDAAAAAAGIAAVYRDLLAPAPPPSRTKRFFRIPLRRG